MILFWLLGWGTRVYLWWIHVDIWQNQYNIVKLKNKIKKNLLLEFFHFITDFQYLKIVIIAFLAIVFLAFYWNITD